MWSIGALAGGGTNEQDGAHLAAQVTLGRYVAVLEGQEMGGWMANGSRAGGWRRWYMNGVKKGMDFGETVRDHDRNGNRWWVWYWVGKGISSR